MSKTMNKCKDYHSRWVIKTFYSKIRERNVNYFLIYKEYNQRYLNKCHNKRNRKRFKNIFLFCSFFKKGFPILSRLIFKNIFGNIFLPRIYLDGKTFQLAGTFYCSFKKEDKMNAMAIIISGKKHTQIWTVSLILHYWLRFVWFPVTPSL